MATSKAKSETSSEAAMDDVGRRDARKQYWAFISYSSKDRRWGVWLHRRLENYSIPADFRGLEVFDGAVLGKNLRPVFRDRDELSSSSDLGAAILKALHASRFLVVLCSKNAAKSKWVNKEIEDFQAMGKGGRILALILDGVPNATAAGNSDEECFPPALRYPAEPIAGDMRKEGDGKARGFLKILAGIAQLDFDKLYRRHERYQFKRRFFFAMLSTLLIGLFAVLAMVAWSQKNKTMRESSLSHFWQGSRMLVEGQTSLGLAYLSRALRTDASNDLVAKRIYSALTERRFAVPKDAPVCVGESAFKTVFSPSGKFVVVAGSDDIVRLLDVQSWRITHQFRHAQQVQNIELSDDGAFLMVLSVDKIEVYCTDTGNPAGPAIDIACVGGMPCADLSGDGAWVVAGGGLGVVYVWDVVSGRMVSPELPHQHRLIAGKGLVQTKIAFVQFDSKRKKLATSCNNGTAVIWDVKNWQPAVPILEHGMWVDQAIFSPDDKILATVCHDGKLRLWDVETGELIRLPLDHKHWIQQAVFSPEGKRILTRTVDGVLRIWDLLNGKLLLSMSEHRGQVYDATWSPDGNSVVSCGHDRRVGIWDARYGFRVIEPVSFSDRILSVSFHPSGTQFVAGLGNGEVHLYSFDRTPAMPELIPHHSILSAPFCSQDDRFVVLTEERIVRVWDLQSGQAVSPAVAFDSPVVSAVLHPTGDRILVATSKNEITQWEWDQNEMKQVGRAARFEGARLKDTLTDVKYLDNGAIIAAASRKFRCVEASEWINSETGERISEMFSQAPPSWFADPTAKMTFCLAQETKAGGGSCVTFSRSAFASIQKTDLKFSQHGRLRKVEFSPDGVYVIVLFEWGSFGEELLVLEAQTGRQVFEENHLSKGHLRSVVWSGDGKFIALSSDRGVRLIDCGQWTPTGRFIEHDSAVSSVALDKSGRILVSGCDDGSVHVWDCRTGAELADPLQLENPVDGVWLVYNGRVLIWSQGLAWLWDLPPVVEKQSPGWLADFAESVAGIRIKDAGDVDVLPNRARVDSLRSIAANDSEGTYEELARWFLLAENRSFFSPKNRQSSDMLKRRMADTYEMSVFRMINRRGRTFVLADARQALQEVLGENLARFQGFAFYGRGAAHTLFDPQTGLPDTVHMISANSELWDKGYRFVWRAGRPGGQFGLHLRSFYGGGGEGKAIYADILSRRSVQSDPGNEEFWWLRGTLLVNLGNHDEAKQSVLTALSLKNVNAGKGSEVGYSSFVSPFWIFGTMQNSSVFECEQNVFKGVTLMNVGLYEESVQFLERALTQDTNSVYALRELCRLKVFMEEYEDGASLASKAMALTEKERDMLLYFLEIRMECNVALEKIEFVKKDMDAYLMRNPKPSDRFVKKYRDYLTPCVEVVSVSRDGQAYSLGIQASDLLESYDGKRIETKGDVTSAVNSCTKDTNIPFVFRRNGVTRTLFVERGKLGIMLQNKPRALDSKQDKNVGLIRNFAPLGVSYNTFLSETMEKAERGEPQAQWYLAIMYLYGMNIKEDVSLGIKWLNAASVNGDVFAKALLGNILMDGLFGMEINTIRAFSLLRDVESATYDKTMYILQFRPQHLPDMNPVAAANISLGVAFANGTGCNKNLDEAERYIQKAVLLGSKKAEKLLGMVCVLQAQKHSDRVSEDRQSKCTYYLEKGSALGNLDAMRKLGQEMVQNNKSKESFAQGLVWLEKASNAGDDGAKELLKKWAQK